MSNEHVHFDKYMEKIGKGLTLEEDYNLAVESLMNNDYENAAQKFSEIVYVSKTYKSAAYYLLLTTEIGNDFSMIFSKLSLMHRKVLDGIDIDEQEINRLLQAKARRQAVTELTEDVEPYTEGEMTSSKDPVTSFIEGATGLAIFGVGVLVIWRIVGFFLSLFLGLFKTSA